MVLCAARYYTCILPCAVACRAASAYFCLTPVVLVDLLGLENFCNAFGVVLFFQGIGGVIGPPVAGTADTLIAIQHIYLHHILPLD